MSESDRERAKRIIDLLIQYTRPGQIQIPFHWVYDDDEPKQNTVAHKFYVDDDVNVLNDSGSGTVESSQEKDLAEVNLEDGELLEIDDEIEDVLRKENVVSSANTSFNSSNGSYNGSCSNNNVEIPRSAKEEAKRQKFGHVICKFFREGHCREGNSCCYSHNASDSHRLPELCKGYIIGKCRKALNCNLLHGEHPCKDYHFGRCNVLKCRFSHQPLNDYTKAIFEKALKDEEDAITVASVNTNPIPPRFSSFQNNAVPINCPPQIFSHHSHPFSTSMKTNPNSLAYNKKAFRQKVGHPYNKKLSKSKPISPLQYSTAANEKGLLSDVVFNLPQSC
uniref:C3H1-type domain-containing protein n=1 Tax=Panagrolaimus davidi TaxID=227884 RepID=A0A914P9K4_9BILA